MAEQDPRRPSIQERIRDGNFRGVVTAPEFSSLSPADKIQAVLQALDVKMAKIANNPGPDESKYTDRTTLLGELRLVGEALTRAHRTASQGGLGARELMERIHEETDRFFHSAGLSKPTS